MNRIVQRNEIELELQSFKDFVPFASFDEMPMLMSGIANLYRKLAWIKKMGLDDLTKEVNYDYELRNSKINFSDYEY